MAVHDIKLLDDRNYLVGDLLIMHELEENQLTGRKIVAEVICKLKHFAGLNEGYCILGIRVLR